MQGRLFEARRTDTRPCLAIHQRLYLGSKRQLLPFIHEILSRHVGPFASFGDFFAGTGVVGHSVNGPEVAVVANELLYANWCTLDAFLGPEPLDRGAYADFLDRMDALPLDGDGYFDEAYGGRYFGHRDARRIGAMRQAIDDWGVTGRLRSVLVASLLYSIDRVAHTCGHYDAYRTGMLQDDHFVLSSLDLPDGDATAGNVVVNGDANALAERVDVDVVYLDPPYNSRQYADAYHLLENLARWQKPRLVGKARKFDRRGLKSRFNVKDAPNAFAELVARCSCRHLLVSYSNMQDKGDPRSQNRIEYDYILAVLGTRGDVRVFERPFKAFSAGKGRVDDHAERLFWCRVTTPSRPRGDA